MLILNKKRLLFINSIIVFSILFNCINFSKTSIMTSSTPVSNHTIILDAGHGFPDGGATSSDGIIESEINLNIVLKLQKLLEASNCTVLLTRSDENGIYDTDADTIKKKKISDMKNRVKIANDSEGELFISIHQNKLQNGTYSGWQTFYKNNDKESNILARSIQSSLNSYLKEENTRTIKSISGIYLTKNVDIPLVIVECGFLSNDEESKLLEREDYQDKLAFSIYIGIMDYLK